VLRAIKVSSWALSCLFIFIQDNIKSQTVGVTIDFLPDAEFKPIIDIVLSSIEKSLERFLIRFPKRSLTNYYERNFYHVFHFSSRKARSANRYKNKPCLKNPISSRKTSGNLVTFGSKSSKTVQTVSFLQCQKLQKLFKTKGNHFWCLNSTFMF
jgi:hypothetical protein